VRVGNGEQADDRPFHRLLAAQAAPFVAMFMVVMAFAIGAVSDAPEGLSSEAWHALLVFLLCLVLWVTQLLPLAVTSLLGMALLPILGVMPASNVFALFGNPAVFFILGAFMLVAGVMQSGLSERVALGILDRVAHTPKQLLCAMLLLPALMACVMPEHAVAALFLPIAWEIVRSLGLKKGHVYAQAIFFALAWGAIIGGVTTLLGGARGPLALALSTELTGHSFSFLQWTLAALPLVIGVLSVALYLLLRMSSYVTLDLQVVRHRFAQRRLELGALGVKGWMMAVLMLGTVLAWMLAGHANTLASISLIAVVLMFALRLVEWKAIEQHVSWSVVLMYGGAIAVGSALSVSGAGAWLAMQFFPAGIVGLSLIIVLTLATLLLTEGVSNAASVAILLPIAIPVGLTAGIDPLTIALAVGIIAGFAFMLPMGTPPNAMIYGTGFVQRLAMLRFGAVLSLTALLLFIVLVWRWWPVVGFGIIG
jgi:anion transporter